ncbi:zf-TFIIB domain-containing protein [Poriferisphaera sp. WC338]|uniref:TFIIB-type zinc ribbon-containing protein n=1 Tax=Poriferisphaera sp. WC338 TaxID=3425129 RepID=UPI003D8169BF
MNCPKCESGMEAVTVDEVEVDRCTSCAGIWLDALEFDKLKETKDADTLDTGNASTGNIHNTERNIKCPKCKTLMVAMSFHDQPHIQYEMCSTCGGIYLDAGEFKDAVTVTLSEQLRGIWRG